MAKFNINKNNFKSGQLGELLDGRTDLKEYKNGVKTMKNAFPMIQGGVEKRTGTNFIADISTHYSGDAIGSLKKIPLETSEGDTLIFNLTESTAVKHLLLKESAGDFTDVTATEMDNTGSILAESVYTYQYVQYGNEVYFSRGNNIFSNDNEPTVLYKLNSNTSNGAAADKWRYNTLEQFIDDANNDLTNTVFKRSIYLAFPWLEENNTTITLQVAATSGTGINLTANSPIFEDTVTGTGSKWVGSYFRINGGASEGIIKITSRTSDTVLVGDIVLNFPSTAAQTEWQESAWSVVRGWPGAVTAYEGRLVYGGTDAEPGKMWFSAFEDITVFMQGKYKLAQDKGATDTSGFKYHDTVIQEDAVDYGYKDFIGRRISFLQEGRVLEIGTEKDVRLLNSPGGIGSTTDAVTITKQSDIGAAATQPVRSEISTIYSERIKGISQFTLDPKFESVDRYISNQLAILNQELITGEIRQLVYDSHRKTLYVLVYDSDINYGFKHKLYGLYVDQIENTAGWTVFDFKNEILGLCVFDEDPNVYMTFANSAGYVEEKLVGSAIKLELATNPNVGYLDSYKTGTVSSTNVILSLDHLDGEVVHVLGNIIISPIVSNFTDSDVDISANTITDTSHGFSTGMEVKLSSLGPPILPEGLGDSSVGTKFVIKVDDDTYKLAETRTDAFNEEEIDIIRATSGGSHTATQQPVYQLFKDLTVASNQVTLPSNITDFVVGLPYEFEIETLKIDGGLNVEGSSQGQVKGIDEVTTRVWNSQLFYVGDKDHQYPADFDNTDLFTGDIVSKFDQGKGTDNRVKITSSDPYPLFITGLMIKGVTYE